MSRHTSCMLGPLGSEVVKALMPPAVRLPIGGSAGDMSSLATSASISLGYSPITL